MASFGIKYVDVCSSQGGQQLPRPDAFGNFWLGSHKDDPAIFPSKRVRAVVVERAEGYLLFIGRAQGFACEGNRLAVYPSPEAALEALDAARGL